MGARSGRTILKSYPGSLACDDLKELLVLGLANSYIRCWALLAYPAVTQETRIEPSRIRKPEPGGTNNWMWPLSPSNEEIADAKIAPLYASRTGYSADADSYRFGGPGTAAYIFRGQQSLSQFAQQLERA
jgi:hypothetical protein